MGFNLLEMQGCLLAIAIFLCSTIANDTRLSSLLKVIARTAYFETEIILIVLPAIEMLIMESSTIVT